MSTAAICQYPDFYKAAGRSGIEVIHDTGVVVGAEAQSSQFINICINIQGHLFDNLLYIFCRLIGIVGNETKVAEK